MAVTRWGLLALCGQGERGMVRRGGCCVAGGLRLKKGVLDRPGQDALALADQPNMSDA